VATDVASRGLDVDDISLVVNYHLPEEAATYVHRIGRTARAGKHGIAVAICSSEDAYNQMRIEEFLGDKIPVEWLAEEEMPKDIKIPGRNDEREFSDDEEGGTESASSPARGRGGKPERGGRGSRSGPPRGPRPPGPGRIHPERAPSVGSAPIPLPKLLSEAVTTPTAAAPSQADRNIPRPERGPRGRDRGRGRDIDRGGRDNRDFREPREPLVDPASLPSPLTGNPVIYDMLTGKPKNRTEAEFKQVMNEYNGKISKGGEKPTKRKAAAPAIIKKISSKVTALFGKRSE